MSNESSPPPPSPDKGEAAESREGAPEVNIYLYKHEKPRGEINPAMGASPREDRTEYHFYFTSPPLPGETGDPDNDGRVAVSGTAHSFDRLVKGNLTRGYVDRVPALQKEAGEASVTTVVHELREEQKQTLLQQMHSGVGTISQISAKERNWFDDNFADANATEVSRRLQQKKRDDDRYRGSGTPPPPAKKS